MTSTTPPQSQSPVAFEVRWYRVNGLYPAARIAKDAYGNDYLIGDWSWNRGQNLSEIVEPRINAALFNARAK